MLQSTFKKLFRILSLTFFGAISACGQADSDKTVFPLVPGIKAVATSMGYHFEEEAVAVDGNIVNWRTKWKNQTVATSKLYRGIYPLEVKEENYGFANDFAFEKIDSLFPLSVGKEVSFSGTNQKLGGASPKDQIWVLMTVREITEIELKGGTQEVFVIEIITDTTTDQGVLKETKTLWYSEKLGMSLKKETRVGGKSFVYRVLELFIPDIPADDADRKRNLGTILI